MQKLQKQNSTEEVLDIINGKTAFRLYDTFGFPLELTVELANEKGITVDEEGFKGQDLVLFTEALVQLMNSYQSKGEPESCVTTLQEVFECAPVLQTICLRDYYSVLGYALSRTENIDEAEKVMLRALTLPLYEETPERYFRDYAYAAAVFFSNPNYHNEVILSYKDDTIVDGHWTAPMVFKVEFDGMNVLSIEIIDNETEEKIDY